MAKFTYDTRFQFESMGELLAHVAPDHSGKPARSEWGSLEHSSQTGTKSFTGTRSLAEAIGLARDGWPEGRRKMAQALTAAAAASHPDVSPDYMLDVAGAYPFVPAAAAGDPLNMVSPAPVESRRRPIIKLLVSFCYSAGFSTEQVMNYGGAVMSYVDALEAGGYRTEIIMTYSSGWKPNEARILPQVTVKRAEEPLDIDRVGFALAHPSMLRRIGFALLETCGDYKILASGYGMVCEPEPDAIPDGFIYVPGPNVVRGAALRDPALCLKSLSAYMDKALFDRYAVPPPIQFDFD